MRESDISKYIHIAPGVRSGKPVFIGSRITVADVLEMLANGMSFEAIEEDFPKITKEHVQAALLYAAHKERITLSSAA